MNFIINRFFYIIVLCKSMYQPKASYFVTFDVCRLGIWNKMESKAEASNKSTQIGVIQ